MKRILALLMIFILALSMTPGFSAENDIVDIASGSSDFTVLVAALQEADLVGALQDEGPFTVFAPTDAAFTALLSDLNITAEDLLGHPQLAQVLLYHVVPGKVMSTDLSDGMIAETLKGDDLMVDLSDGVMINDSNVVTADIEATNGVIHVIDKVLVPDDFVLSGNDIVDIALSDPNFSMLVSLLQKADLVSALQAEGPFTVFAPTNAAFEDLLAALDITASDLMQQPDLAKVLLYHVVNGKAMSTDLSDGMQIPTLNGESLNIDLSDGVMINDSSVVNADIQAVNGVIHVIDKILVPTNFTLQEIEEDTVIPYTGTTNVTPSLFVIAGFAVFALYLLVRTNKQRTL